MTEDKIERERDRERKKERKQKDESTKKAGNRKFVYLFSQTREIEFY
jgi:hypothetical protein